MMCFGLWNIKGITLIARVITIIMLLILAGVSLEVNITPEIRYFVIKNTHQSK